MTLFSKSFISATLTALALGGTSWTPVGATSTTPETYTPSVGQQGKDVVWVPTPQALVDRMLDLAQLRPEDILVDLGSGDGRTVITAAKRGATARGIEFNPDMVELSKRNARTEGVSDRARFEQADIFESDFSDATVVTLFLLPHLNVKLRPLLLKMPPGTRVLANSFDMGEWQPDEIAEAIDGCHAYCKALKWVVPAQVDGVWMLEGKPLNLKQTFQMLEGTLDNNGTGQAISQAKLNGKQISFTLGQDHYTGEVDGARMQGTVNGSRRWQASR